MVDDERLDLIFSALSDRTRRAMLSDLADGDRSVSDLAAPHHMSLAGASKHVGVLEKAKLIRREKRGRQHICSLEAEELRAAQSWLETYDAFWTERLDALEDLLKREDENNG